MLQEKRFILVHNTLTISFWKSMKDQAAQINSLEALFRKSGACKSKYTLKPLLSQNMVHFASTTKTGSMYQFDQFNWADKYFPPLILAVFFWVGLVVVGVGGGFKGGDGWWLWLWWSDIKKLICYYTRRSFQSKFLPQCAEIAHKLDMQHNMQNLT